MKKEVQNKRIENINKINKVCIVLIILCVIFIVFLIIKNSKKLTPDYAPGTIDVNAIKEKDSDKKMPVTSGGGAVRILYSNVISVDTKNKELKLYFKNPNSSRESIVLEVIILQGKEEYVIAKSELLPPGYTLYNLGLNSKNKLPKGGYKGKFRITYYNEETGEKEILNTEIEASVEVK